MALEVLTHSKRRNFSNCRRYYLHAHLQNLTPRIQKHGRRRGTIFGQTLEFIRLHKDDPDFHLRAYVEAKVDRVYDEILDKDGIDPYDVDGIEVEAALMMVMVEAYIERYGHDVRREIEFRMPLVDPFTGAPSKIFQLGGKIDGIARMKTLNGVRMLTLIEDKLVQSIQKAMILRLPLDAQVSEYVDAVISRGLDAKVLYRHTRWSSMKPKPPKEFKTKDNYPGETLNEYKDRVRESIDENPSSYFDEQDLYFPKDHLADYRAGRWGTAVQIAEAQRVFRDNKMRVGNELTLRLQAAFPMNSTRCWEYGGCEFIPLCTKQPGAEDLYVRQADNPELDANHGEGVLDEYGTQ